jgi:large subunit ribosomal protein L18
MQARIDRKNMRRTVRFRIRRKVSGTSARPRLAVFRSDKHIYVQAIDDEGGRTLASASTRDGDVRGELATGATIEAAKRVGRAIAGKLKSAGVDTVVFDRGGFVYHGRIKALAEAAREGGLRF